MFVCLLLVCLLLLLLFFVRLFCCIQPWEVRERGWGGGGGGWLASRLIATDETRVSSASDGFPRVTRRPFHRSNPTRKANVFGRVSLCAACVSCRQETLLLNCISENLAYRSERDAWYSPLVMFKLLAKAVNRQKWRTSSFLCTLLGPYAPQGSTSLLPKLSVTSKVSARTSYAWFGSRVHFRRSDDVALLEFTSPVDRECMCRRRKFHWI